MPRKRRLLLGTWIILAMFAGASRVDAVPGCPFCAPSEDPFSQRLAACQYALEVKWVSLKQGTKAGEESTTFEVVTPFRTGTRTFKPKDPVVWAWGRNAKPGDLFLLIGTDDGDDINWAQPVSLSSEYLYAYVRKVPSPESPDRLQFFLKFLEFPDSDICNDAYAEFSRAQFKDVAALAPKLPREKLRKWLASDEPQLQIRKGLYGMMLGLGGDNTDAEFLEQQIMTQPQADKPRLGIDGMMAGYMLLRGERGLDKLMKAKFDDPKAEDDLVALRNAIMFLWDYAQDRVPPAALRSAMRKFLDRPSIATNVVENLSRWKDWDSLDRLIATYGKAPFDSPLSKQKIVAFALACERDGKKTSPEKLPISAIKARRFLQSLDPDFVKSVDRTFFNAQR